MHKQEPIEDILRHLWNQLKSSPLNGGNDKIYVGHRTYKLLHSQTDIDDLLPHVVLDETIEETLDEDGISWRSTITLGTRIDS